MDSGHDPFPLDLESVPEVLGPVYRALDRAVLERQVWQLGLALAAAIRQFGDDEGKLRLDERNLRFDAGETVDFAAFGKTLYCRLGDGDG